MNYRMDCLMNKIILGLTLSLIFSSASASFSFNSNEEYNDYPPPEQCPEPRNQNYDAAFCQCFIDQSVIGCKYASDGAFYCNEAFVKSKIMLVGNNDDSILNFCHKYEDTFPKNGTYTDKVCLAHVKYYKNNC